jgi:heme exporter protein B
VLKIIVRVIRRDLLLAARQKADVLNTLFFFVVVVTMVPLGIGPEPNLLRAIAPGVVWVAALLAAILSLARLFANDYADGTLEQMLLAEPLPLIVLGKATAWLVTGLPLTLMSIVFESVRSGFPGDGVLVAAAAGLAGAVIDQGGRSCADARAAGGVLTSCSCCRLCPGADFRRRSGWRSGFGRHTPPPPASGRFSAVCRF